MNFKNESLMEGEIHWKGLNELQFLKSKTTPKFSGVKRKIIPVTYREGP
jgi:hypothetical protein